MRMNIDEKIRMILLRLSVSSFRNRFSDCEVYVVLVYYSFEIYFISGIMVIWGVVMVYVITCCPSIMQWIGPILYTKRLTGYQSIFQKGVL